VFDVDGTLLTSRHEVSPRMQAVCRVLAGQGVWLSIASARPPTSVQRIAQAIGAHGPLCALNGAIILRQDGTLERRLSMPLEIASALIRRFMLDDRVSLNVYSGTEWTVPQMDGRIQAEARIVGFEPKVSPNMDRIGSVEKILIMTDEALAAALIQALAADDTAVVVARSNPFYVEITPVGVDKALGVGEAARLAGLSPGELAVCGDGENDITMLTQAGYGIAMGHSPLRLRSVAQQVVGSNDDDSLPAALEVLFNRV